MSKYGKIVSSIASGVGILYHSILERPLVALAVLFWLTTVTGAYFAGKRANAPSPSSTPLRGFESPSSALDLLRESAPDGAKQANIPDTSKTDTVRIVTRKFTTKTDTVYSKNPTARLEQSQPSLTLEATLKSLPYNFILLPTVEGKPTVNVNQDRTVIEAIRPDNASSLRITYDHPNPSWEIGPLGSISAIKSNKVYTSGKLGLYLQYRNVRIEPTYRFSPIRNRTGLNLTLEWSLDWISF